MNKRMERAHEQGGIYAGIKEFSPVASEDMLL
jgi:hypothetical protein